MIVKIVGEPMCGIIAVSGKNVTVGLLKRLLKPIWHRGSKRYECTVFKSGGMGTNRLPIVDADSGKQPFTNEGKTIFAVMNGEIYNHHELREELISKGHILKTTCDTEIVPHLYEEYGAAFVQKIDSEMFVIILHDTENDVWIAVRDPLGIKPLYTTTDRKRRIYFSSEIKQLVSIGSTIHEFPQGTISINGKLRCYTHLPKTTVQHVSRKDVIKELRILIDDAVRKRLPPNLPVGVFLSGGVDSTSILATALKYTKDVTAFIAGNRYSEDRRIAIDFCKESGVSYEAVNIRSPTKSDIKKLVRCVETNNRNVIVHSWPAYMLAKRAAKRGFKVVLCGEGADELFAGYNEFLNLPPNNVERGVQLLTKSLHATQCQRVDRTSMAHTIEVRTPFLDTNLVQFALSIPGRMKIKKHGERLVTKSILREAMLDRLPCSIAWRKKMPFATGAGLSVGDQEEKKNMPEERAKKMQRWDQEFIDCTFHSLFGAKPISQPPINKDNLHEACRIAENAEGILKAIKRMKFIRYIGSTVERLLIQHIVANTPLKFVLFWGASAKKQTDAEDLKTIENIRRVQMVVANQLPGTTEIVVILADEHAFHNGYDPLSVYNYLKEIETMFEREGIRSIYLSRIWGEEKVSLETKRSLKWNDLSPNCHATLLRGASRMYLKGDANSGAQQYAEMRLMENPAIEKKYEGSILLVFGRSETDEILPKFPKIVLGTGTTSKPPWVVGEEGTAWSGYNGFTRVNKDK